MEDFIHDKPVKRRPPNRRIFSINPDAKLQKNLKYFMLQELGYYNVLIETFNSRVKAFPQDILSIRDRGVKLLETCAQFAYDPEKLTNSKNDTWPEAFKTYGPVIYDSDWTEIKVPYSKEWITVLGYDLTEIPYTTMVIRAPNIGEETPTWRIEFKDQPNKYILNLSDPRVYKRKKRQ